MLECADRAQQLGAPPRVLDPFDGGDVALEPVLGALALPLCQGVDASEQLGTLGIEAPRPFVPGERLGSFSGGLEQFSDLGASSHATVGVRRLLGAQREHTY